MERLETKLFEAAALGRISMLQNLLKEDPLILNRIVVNSFSETPLHVAAMLGHTDFVREIIRIDPQLTTELNSMQSSPLHLASAKGHVDVVRALLSANPETCLARDKNSLTPLHLAALKGRIEVMKALLQEKPDAAQLTVYRGENILHLCIKHYQLEALKLLVSRIGDTELINSKDTDGNTFLHLAVAYKQVEVIDFLLAVPALDVNALNSNGMTAMDLLTQSRRDIRDEEIEESLKQAGGFRMLEGSTAVNMNRNMDNQALSPSPDHLISSANKRRNNRTNLVNHHDDWLERKRSALMIVASLIATMAFQVGVNPPGSVWQDDYMVDADGNPVSNSHRAGFSIMARNVPLEYTGFYVVNTVSFIASLSIILLLMSGLPIKRRLFIGILMVITWVAISAIAESYLKSIVAVTPSIHGTSVYNMIKIAVYMWDSLMALLLISHTIRLIVKMVKRLRKALMRRTQLAGSIVSGV